MFECPVPSLQVCEYCRGSSTMRSWVGYMFWVHSKTENKNTWANLKLIIGPEWVSRSRAICSSVQYYHCKSVSNVGCHQPCDIGLVARHDYSQTQMTRAPERFYRWFLVKKGSPGPRLHALFSSVIIARLWVQIWMWQDGRGGGFSFACNVCVFWSVLRIKKEKKLFGVGGWEKGA